METMEGLLVVLAVAAASFGTVLSSRGGAPRGVGVALIVLAFSMLAVLGMRLRGWL